MIKKHHVEEDHDDDILVDPTPVWKRKRYFIGILAFCGLFNIFALRNNLSVGIVEMTRIKEIVNADGSITYEQLFDWSSKQKGFVLSSYFGGFILTQILGGVISQRIGGHLPFGIAVGVSSILNLLTPIAANISIYALIGIRVVDGLFEGVTYASLYNVCSKWVPPKERSRVVMGVTSGGHIGAVVSLAASGILAKQINWQSTFYVFGSIGCVWSVVWLLLAKSSPALDPRISEGERNYIQETLNRETQHPITEIPWKAIITSSAVWAIIVAQFADIWGLFTLQTQLPQFLNDVLDFDIEASGILSAVPYLCMAITLHFAGFLADYILVKEILSTRNTRRYFNCAAFLGQMVCLFCALFFLSPVTSVVLISIGVSIASFAHAGYAINFLEIAPQFSGIIMGISNTIATISGIVSPLLTGFIVTTQSKGEWQIVFYIAAGMYLLGAIVYWIFCEGIVQPWAIQHRFRNQSLVSTKSLRSIIERSRF